MFGTSTPKKPMIEERGGDHLSPRSSRQSSSILGLSIVSGLNVASLFFIIYHFIAHSPEPAVALKPPSATSDVKIAVLPLRTDTTIATSPGALGNVDLAPTSMQVISIASGFVPTDGELDDHLENGSMTSAKPERVDGAKATNTDEHSGHWVQLGALSKEAMARRYWSGLKLRHKSLIHEREPRYFGPAEVGGSLYHIRLGPMAGDAATGLCEKLEAEGADCFRVKPRDDVAP